MKPILFNTEMVKAILSGRKTVTRRVVKDPYCIEDEEVKLIGTYINNKGGGIETQTLDVSKTLTYKGRECEWRTITDKDGRRHVVLAVKPEN